MRRSILAVCTALAVALSPLAAYSVDDPVQTADAEASAEADVVVPDLEEPALPVDQRFGFTAEPQAPTETAAVVQPGITALPAPQPGAEVYDRPADGVYQVRGGGFGHGIGMSQYGADGAGRAGLTHAQILAFYYPGTVLETRTTGTIRIGLTVDSDGDTRVAHRAGLVVGNAPGGATYPLPSGYSQWRVRTTTAAATGCTLEGLSSSGTWTAVWPTGLTRSCPISFSSPTEGTVDLYLPTGQPRIYRGTLTATHRGTTSLLTVNHLPLQHYLRSVTMAEMPVSFHAQALRAQAVAARTYALRGAGGTAYYDTCDTTACQAYRGRGVRNADGSVTSYEHANSTAAVDATDGQVLTYDFGTGTRQLATTMYSSSTGGHTTAAGAGHGYLRPQPDPYDAVAGNARHSWTAALPAARLEARYGIHRVERVQILRRDGHGQWGGRVLEARVEGYTAGGAYTWATATGDGLQLANPWPGNANGLSSTYFTIVGGDGGTGTVERIAGTDRYATAAEASRAWGAGTGVVYVVNGNDYPDALAAAARAGVYDAPVLLTQRDRIPSETLAAMARLTPARVVVVGGTGSVSDAVATRLRGLTTTNDLTRVGGVDRYDTAAQVASYYPANQSTVYLANGQDFPDALAGAALAGHGQLPLLLTRPDRLSSVTATQLQRLRPREVVVLGGTTAVSDAVARQAATYTTSGTFRRLAGANRYETMERVAAQFPAGRGPAYVASASSFPDALVGAALAGGLRGVPILLTAPERVPLPTATALGRQSPQSIYVLGGPGAVTDSTMDALRAHLR
ncbi:hypothetical protein GCM10009584_21580 [Ornithinimicrobium humiphilum]|uniref:SpoIID/LytB domain protein n=1 Tax=Ornithinimicrobium humiphilum TaxID=125288 RepID=A0A543KN95_9MICO|nr:cell wall-binding repeat-containing protein [Ornithinimicrobium humiphilum]TQM96547.1 SpoIID/LytB domain protein [Ornithinimicrobium humiphilum]